MMILDTNVISEPMKPGANPAVQNWLDQQYAETLFYPQGSALSRRTVNNSDNGGAGGSAGPVNHANISGLKVLRMKLRNAALPARQANWQACC